MDLILRNLMEDIVIKQLDELIPIFGCCDCNQCRLDIASYALNRLPSKYVVTTQGELLTKLDSLDVQFDTDVTAVVSQAILHVSKNPRHKINKDDDNKTIKGI